MKAVYIAHPLGTSDRREVNRRNAAKWVAYLAERYGIAPVADWIVLASVWPEEKRDLAIAVDLALVERCDELWLVGGRVSAGMQLEADHARAHGIPVVDITGLGWAVPT